MRISDIIPRVCLNNKDLTKGLNDPEVLLTEFADEDNTLTYFRTPVIQNPLFVDDELIGGK